MLFVMVLYSAEGLPGKGPKVWRQHSCIDDAMYKLGLGLEAWWAASEQDGSG